MDELQKRGLCPFTFARPGDKVYNQDNKYGVVDLVDFNRSYLNVKFDNGIEQKFTISGCEVKRHYTPSDCQILFWDDQLTKKPMMPNHIAERKIVIIQSEIGFGG